MRNAWRKQAPSARATADGTSKMYGITGLNDNTRGRLRFGSSKGKADIICLTALELKQSIHDAD
jgi:hypothetical protein